MHKYNLQFEVGDVVAKPKGTRHYDVEETSEDGRWFTTKVGGKWHFASNWLLIKNSPTAIDELRKEFDLEDFQTVAKTATALGGRMRWTLNGIGAYSPQNPKRRIFTISDEMVS